MKYIFRTILLHEAEQEVLAPDGYRLHSFVHDPVTDESYVVVAFQQDGPNWKSQLEEFVGGLPASMKLKHEIDTDERATLARALDLIPGPGTLWTAEDAVDFLERALKQDGALLEDALAQVRDHIQKAKR